jgi:hypothetical protein
VAVLVRTEVSLHLAVLVEEEVQTVEPETDDLVAEEVQLVKQMHPSEGLVLWVPWRGLKLSLNTKYEHCQQT